MSTHSLNTLRPRQDGRRFPDDTFERIFLKENVIILIKISLKFVHNGPINNIPALVQIMAWRRPGDKPLSESMMVRLATHICVTPPQWVNMLLATFNQHLFAGLRLGIHSWLRFQREDEGCGKVIYRGDSRWCASARAWGLRLQTRFGWAALIWIMTRHARILA